MALLIDTSKSMKTSHRTQLDSILDQLIDKLGVSSEGNHFAVITFDHDAILHNNLTDPLYHSKENLKSAVKDSIMKEASGWGTRTDFALNVAETEGFTREGGDRPEAKNVVTAITDKSETVISKNDKRPLIPFAETTKALEVSQSVTYQGRS